MSSPQAQSARLRPFNPIPFGRYTLLSPIATGGMGEIFLAKLGGHGGFEKLCVIKRILPHLAADPAFVERFVNEARTLVALQHGSIAQVLDMGLQEGDPYIAIEYVDGKDLRRVASALRERGQRIPIPVVLFAMTRVLDALGYAHRKRGADEKEIGLVHRDVSPQNILVSYEGEVKVIDFGLAKSRLNASKTHPSIILGKFLYMAPEQVKHQGVDRRTDLYAVGMCLYELLSGKNPFEDVHPAEIMATVGSPQIPPLRSVVPEISEKLEAIVLRALRQNPDERFQTAEELRAELLQQLHQLVPGAGPELLSTFMRETFAPEYQSERRLLQALKDSATLPAELAPAARGAAETGTFQAVTDVAETSTARGDRPRPAAGPAPAPAPARAAVAKLKPDLPVAPAPGGERLEDTHPRAVAPVAPYAQTHAGPPPGEPDAAETMPAVPIVTPDDAGAFEDTHPRVDVAALAAQRAARNANGRRAPPEKPARPPNTRPAAPGPSPTVAVDDAQLLMPASPRSDTPLSIPRATALPELATSTANARTLTPVDAHGSTEDIPVRRAGTWKYVAVAAGVFALGVGGFLGLQSVSRRPIAAVPAPAVDVAVGTPIEEPSVPQPSGGPDETPLPGGSATDPGASAAASDTADERSAGEHPSDDPEAPVASAGDPTGAEDEAPVVAPRPPTRPQPTRRASRTRVTTVTPLQEEWARTQAAFEQVTSRRSCDLASMTLVCVRYRSLEREVRAAQSAAQQDAAMARVRSFQGLLVEKGATF